MKPMNKNMMEAWKQEVCVIAALYQMVECGERIPVNTDRTDYEFIEPLLDDMDAKELITPNGEYWGVTVKGNKLLGQMAQMLDHALKFEIFGAVNLNRGLTPEEQQDDNPFLVPDDRYDPRFAKSLQSEDLRLAMITFMAECGNTDIDQHRIVFLQKLGSGRLKSNDFWYNLRVGVFFQEVDQIVKAAYKWRDISPNDYEEAQKVMSMLYTAGMLEAQKRDGMECAKCGTPLAIAELFAARENRTLTECPSCQASYQPPSPSEFVCPKCEHAIAPRQRKCHGCGARIDRSLTPGTVVEETITETVVEEEYVPVWGNYYYDYSPYGLYDPWDFAVDVLAFGCLAAVIW